MMPEPVLGNHNTMEITLDAYTIINNRSIAQNCCDNWSSVISINVPRNVEQTG